MTIQELIAELQKCPASFEVFFSDHEYGYCSVDHVYVRPAFVTLGDGVHPDASKSK